MNRVREALAVAVAVASEWATRQGMNTGDAVGVAGLKLAEMLNAGKLELEGDRWKGLLRCAVRGALIDQRRRDQGMTRTGLPTSPLYRHAELDDAREVPGDDTDPEETLNRRIDATRALALYAALSAQGELATNIPPCKAIVRRRAAPARRRASAA